jgi:hypothetical protein
VPRCDGSRLQLDLPGDRRSPSPLACAASTCLIPAKSTGTTWYLVWTLDYVYSSKDSERLFTRCNGGLRTYFGYSDADCAGGPNSRRSRTGYCFFLFGNLVAHQSKLQHCVALSTCEAELPPPPQTSCCAMRKRRKRKGSGPPCFGARLFPCLRGGCA